MFVSNVFQGFPGGSVVKNLPTDAGDAGSISGSGRFPGGGNGNPLQYSCLGNPMDRGVWWATVHAHAKESDMTEHTLLIKERIRVKMNLTIFMFPVTGTKSDTQWCPQMFTKCKN